MEKIGLRIQFLWETGNLFSFRILSVERVCDARETPQLSKLFPWELFQVKLFAGFAGLKSHMAHILKESLRESRG